MNRGPMGVNSLPKTVTRQRCGCDLNPGPTAPESSTLTTQLPSHQVPPLCDSRVTNISKSFTHKMAAKTSWHRYGTKLRHCHPMYMVTVSGYTVRVIGRDIKQCCDPSGQVFVRLSVSHTPRLKTVHLRAMVTTENK